MLPLLLFVALAADVPATPGMQAVGGLTGCWRVAGEVQGRASPSIAKGAALRNFEDAGCAATGGLLALSHR